MLRKRIKKKKPLKLFTKQMLHSKISKSTYFYKQWSSWTSACHNIFANGFRWSSRHCEQNSSGFRLRDGANPTRSSLAFKNPYSKNAYGRLGLNKSYILPVTCSLALLLVLGFAINPFAQGGGGEKAYAVINEDLGNGSTISLAIYNNGSEVADNGAVSTNVNAGQVSYISNLIKVTTNKIGKYYIGIQAASDGTSELVGRDYNATIAGVGSNVSPDSFGDNTWGYALTDNTSTADQNLAYSTLPAYSASTTPQYASTQNPDNGEHELKLTFAAKIRADKPADHYQTTALVSVAAEAREILSINDIDTMQEMTAEICQTAEINKQYQLTDLRDNNTYTIARIKNATNSGTNCWMTQNLRLVGNMTLSSKDSDISQSFYMIDSVSLSSNTFTNLDDEDRVQVYYAGNVANGTYYNWYTATAGTGTISKTSGSTEASICPKGWKLPSGGSSMETTADFYMLFSTLSAATVITAPYNLLTAGLIDLNKIDSERGVLWSSVPNGTNIYTTEISSSNSIVWYNRGISRFSGASVRCVAR